MIQENEVIMVVLGIGVSIFVLVSRLQLKRVPSFEILIIGFSSLVAGWVLTVLEGFFWEESLNFLEHMCYAMSSIFVTAWCWKALGSVKENR
jgi:hypothetical protein